MRASAFAATFVVSTMLALCPRADASDSAVILTYYRFAEPAYPSTNISLATFETHLKELTSGRYRVRPLLDVLNAIRRGEDLPDRTVAITIDDGFASVYEHAWPRLKAAKLPFTVFVATKPIDAGTRGMMTWNQLRELVKSGVTIGAQTHSHPHMVEADPARNADEITTSNRRIAEEIGVAPLLFSYPYGEASHAVMRQVKEAGYRFALGQYSGVANPTMDDFFVPRFGVNEASGDLARFKVAIDALPIRVADVSPANPLVGALNPPPFGFTVRGDVSRIGALNCFKGSGEKVRIERLGESRIEVRLPTALPPGRTRLNCTMPGSDGRWHWYGTSFYVRRAR